MTKTIKILTGLAHIKQAPSMYIGETASPDTLVKELIDNALDEMLNDYATHVEIETNIKEGWFCVKDNGRGLPLDPFKSDDPELSNANGEVSAKLLFTKKESSGKYDKANYNYSGGLHGLGITICNALSTKTVVNVIDRSNKRKLRRYDLELGWKNNIQTVNEQFVSLDRNDDSWWTTSVKIYPDPDVFASMNVRVREIQLQLAKTMKPDATIVLNGVQVQPFDFKQSVDSNLLSDKIFNVSVKYATVNFDLTFGWSSKDFNYAYKGSVNLVTCNDGWHVKEAKFAIGKALNQINPLLSVSDAELGLRLFNNSLISLPRYSSQTKERLAFVDDFKQNNEPILEQIRQNNPDMPAYRVKELASKDKNWRDSSGLQQAISEKIVQQLKENEQFTELMIARLMEYKKSINQLSDETYVTNFIKTGSDKVTRSSVRGVIEAVGTNRKQCELFLCEGRSAGSPIKEGRDRIRQALFELRGKLMNVAKDDKNIQDIIDNEEIKTIVNAIGIGMHPYKIKTEDARYGKIIIATDADPDGLHIQGLILGALCFLVPEVFSCGQDGESMVYIAVAPLFKQGDTFIYDEKNLDQSKPFKRFKGLGSMLPKDLKTTVVDEKTRKLKRINLDESRERALSVITSSAEKKRIMIENKLLVEEI